MAVESGLDLLIRMISEASLTDDACIEWPRYKDKDGYGQMWDRRRNHGKSIVETSQIVHRAAYQLIIGPIPKRMLVCHSCDNPACFRPSHLFLGTPLDNAQDRDAKGRTGDNRGEHHGMAKLTDNAVREMRKLREDGWELEPLARKFGISKSGICITVNRKGWSHVA